MLAIYLAQGNKMSIISHLIYRFPFCVKGQKLLQASASWKKESRGKTQGAPIENREQSFSSCSHVGGACVPGWSNLSTANDKLLSIGLADELGGQVLAGIPSPAS